MLRRWVLALALVASSAAEPAECSGEFQPCFDTRCCSNYGFACYKRAGVNFAQCKRKGTSCGDVDPDWECPGNPEELKAEMDVTMCQPNYKPCFESGCCSSPGFGCWKRAGIRFAQCRPVDPTRKCIPQGDWECPGTWDRPTPEAAGLQCSKPFGACISNKCCVGEAFSCYQKNAHYAQCLKERPDGAMLIEVAHPKYGGLGGGSGGNAGGGGSSGGGGGSSWLFMLVLICAAGVGGYVYRARIDDCFDNFIRTRVGGGGLALSELKSADQKKASGLDDKFVKKEKKNARKAKDSSAGASAGGLMTATQFVGGDDDDDDDDDVSIVDSDHAPLSTTSKSAPTRVKNPLGADKSNVDI